MALRTINVVNLGHTDYAECWGLQQRLFEMRSTDKVGDLLLLTEHSHVYTIGKGGDDNHLLANDQELRLKEIQVFHNDRGGDITYHGPGQLVGYPILDLKNFRCDLHQYLRDLEEVIIRFLTHYGISGSRDAKYTGVWIGEKKICAIGIKTRQWVTMHGFALNVNTDLSFFEGIVPCGIAGKGVTSLRQQLGRDVGVNEVAKAVIHEFGDVFGALMDTSSAGETLNTLRAA
jgi:lipoate-protein ligase B